MCVFEHGKTIKLSSLFILSLVTKDYLKTKKIANEQQR